MNWLLLGGALAAGTLLLKKKAATSVDPTPPAPPALDTSGFDYLLKTAGQKPPAGLPPDIGKLYTTLLNCLANPAAPGCKDVLNQFYTGVGHCLANKTTPPCPAVLQAAWIVLDLCGKHPAIGACPTILAMAKNAGLPTGTSQTPKKADIITVAKADKPKITLAGLLEYGYYLGNYFSGFHDVIPVKKFLKTCVNKSQPPAFQHCPSVLAPGKTAPSDCSYKQHCTEEIVSGTPMSAANVNVAAMYLLQDWCNGKTAALKGAKLINGIVGSGKSIRYTCYGKKSVSASQCFCGNASVKVVKIAGKGKGETLFFAVDTKDLDKMNKKSSGDETGKASGGGFVSIVGGGPTKNSSQSILFGCGTGGYYDCD